MQKISSMNYNVKTIEVFEKQAKRLNKKYASLKNELLNLVIKLKEKPEEGTPIGSNCYKIRLAISSKGKAGGARVIINIVIVEKNVYLLTIYDKSEKENLFPKELQDLLKDISS